MVLDALRGFVPLGPDALCRRQAIPSLGMRTYTKGRSEFDRSSAIWRKLTRISFEVFLASLGCDVPARLVPFPKLPAECGSIGRYYRWVHASSHDVHRYRHVL